MNNLSPMWHTPFAKISGGIQTCQRLNRCRDFEMRYMECLEAYGVNKKGEKLCKDYFEDVSECMTGAKAMARFRTMRFERRKQWLKGERTTEDYYPKDNLDGSYYEND